jgi:hypothetical protein
MLTGKMTLEELFSAGSGEEFWRFSDRLAKHSVRRAPRLRQCSSNPKIVIPSRSERSAVRRKGKAIVIRDDSRSLAPLVMTTDAWESAFLIRGIDAR